MSRLEEKSPVGWEKHYDSPDKSPEVFPFEYTALKPIETRELADGVLYDFGKETFGFLNLLNADPKKEYGVYYGESREEAIDTEFSYLFEKISGNEKYRLIQRAFRYVFIKGGDQTLNLTADYEYLPLEYRGTFNCNNQLFNKIWQTSAYTFHLNTRETFMDGIKRDRCLCGRTDRHRRPISNGHVGYGAAMPISAPT